MAVHLELRDDQTTLTEERIEAAVAAALTRLQSQLGARLRA
jgi:phenylalanyl-tRNA synthetase beta chain